MSVEYLPAGAELVGEIVPRTDLGIDFEEPSPLAYLDARAGVYHSREDGVDRFDLSFDHPALDGLGFYGFLETTAPHRGIGVEDMLADWRMVDSEKYKRLVASHLVLGTSWDEFTTSRPAFSTVGKDATWPGFSSWPHYLLSERAIDMEALAWLGKDCSESVNKMVTTLEEAELENAYGFVIDAVKEECNSIASRRGRPPVTTNEEAERRFKSWHVVYSGKQWFGSRLFRSLPDGEPRQRLVDGVVPQLFDVTETEDGSRIGYPKKYLNEPLANIYERRKKIRNGRFEMTVLSVKNEEGKEVELLVPDTIAGVEDGPQISPLISWYRSKSQERQFNIERYTKEGDAPLFYDGILGALVVAYLSPQIRADKNVWPVQEGLPDRKRKNNMGPAQVPVLVLRQQEHFLGSDFIQAAERLAA